ncbi:MAG: transposase [Cyanobacteria bacterium P01_F01_bin.4]
MPYHSHRHRRPSMRLRGYDYSSQGAYFVTLCTYQRTCLFGKIVNGKSQLSPFGQIADDCWQQIPTHFPNVDLDEFIIMPNHLHGIIVIKYALIKNQPGIKTADRFGNMMKPGALSTIVRSFKSATTRQINILRDAPRSPVWQRNYYDHIIRNAMSYRQIQHYIRNNPLSWQVDQLHPDNPSKG